ncbi:hypothetical protein C8R47DRAFT_1067165 [Mycena vitilis]|nr:hypothetical protein C8R47DRAFT_1067165 [Mycena vitilis]
MSSTIIKPSLFVPLTLALDFNAQSERTPESDGIQTMTSFSDPMTSGTEREPKSDVIGLPGQTSKTERSLDTMQIDTDNESDTSPGVDIVLVSTGKTKALQAEDSVLFTESGVVTNPNLPPQRKTDDRAIPVEGGSNNNTGKSCATRGGKRRRHTSQRKAREASDADVDRTY